LTSTALGKSLAIVALLLASSVLAACGESAQEKAKAEVCSARADISKQLNTLTGLTVSTVSPSQVKTGVESIANDLTKIKHAQGNLAPARKEQVRPPATPSKRSSARSSRASPQTCR